jgi:hypothetical protein
VAVLLVATTLAATVTSTSAESVSTGYKTDGVSDLIWAAEHFGYSGPGEMQRAGVSAIRFILGITGVSESECDLGLADSLDPVGPYVYESEWSAEEAETLEWVANHYCITKAQAQLYGGTLFTFFAGLDAGKNGTTAVREDPPPLTTSSTTTTTTQVPATTSTLLSNDWQAPSAVFVSVTPSTASPGDQVTFRWTAADESGVDWTAVMLCSPVNSMLTSATLVGGNAVEGTYEAVITIPAGYPGGMWQFHIRAKDTLKNSYATNCLEDELTISD